MTHLRPAILAARAKIAEGRARLRLRHSAGGLGSHIGGGLAELIDQVVLDLFRTAQVELAGGEALGQDLALVALGGYGRQDVSPYSDVDLMLLHAPRSEARIKPLAERLLRDLFDAQLDVGHSVRTPQVACHLARRDPIICTSLIETRLLAGNAELLERFRRDFRQQARRHAEGLMTTIDKSRAEERRQYGETVYLLEPNIKRSQGGLRDVQLLRWVGFVRHGTSNLDDLRQLGLIAAEEHQQLLQAIEHLLRLRHEMHFHAGKPCDVLSRAEQVRLAEWAGVTGEPGLLPVEKFMREYFRQTQAVSAIVGRFLAAAQPSRRLASIFAPLVTHRVEGGDYRAGPAQLSAGRRALTRLKHDPAEAVRLFELANLYDKRPDRAACETIRAAVPHFSEEPHPEASRRFLALLGQTGRLGEQLRQLFELGILEKLVPAFRHAHCLLQFNQYHKYTVDEHSLRAVEEAVKFRHDAGPLGRVYRRLPRKNLLHLALLVHDLGKGFPEDHSEVGARIAGETADRLGLPQADCETLVFLVRHHLEMSHLALRRDIGDDSAIARFAAHVGSLERLQLLYLLTAADMAAVGPNTLNDWKADLLAAVYHRTQDFLGGADAGAGSTLRLARLRDDVRGLLSAGDDREWFERQLVGLPRGYSEITAPAQIVEELRWLKSVAAGTALATGRWLPGTKAVEYRVATYESIAPGVFHRLTGALTGQGLRILSAHIYTLTDGLILDRFFVEDPDYAGEPPADRLEAVERALVQSLSAGAGQAPRFRRVFQPRDAAAEAQLPKPPTQVRIDVSSSDRYTIVDVFALDRAGLLYTISRTLHEEGCSVWAAKIGTYLDQVVDVFYVTDSAGSKIVDEERLARLDRRLREALDALERAGD